MKNYLIFFLLIFVGCKEPESSAEFLGTVKEYTAAHPEVKCYIDDIQTVKKGYYANSKYHFSQDKFIYKCSDGAKVYEYSELLL